MPPALPNSLSNKLHSYLGAVLTVYKRPHSRWARQPLTFFFPVPSFRFQNCLFSSKDLSSVVGIEPYIAQDVTLPKAKDTMKAVVFKGPYKVALEDRPVPKIQDPKDIIAKVDYTALCGRHVLAFLPLQYIRAILTRYEANFTYSVVTNPAEPIS